MAKPQRPLTAKAVAALVRLVQRNPMNPSHDLDGALGRYGRALVGRGFAVRTHRVEGYAHYDATDAGRAEVQRMLDSARADLKPSSGWPFK